MLFHSPIFLLIFLPIVFALYYYTSKYSKSAYEYILIVAGIFFYAWWNIYLSPLVLVSIICNFFFGNLIRNSSEKVFKKRILIISIFFNILFLATFKYADFVIQNINYLFDSKIQKLYLPFPLAISFFTFQTIAYLVDCYDGNIKKASLAKYSLFIIFFPQLIAGPIVRYNHMMPQFNNEKNRIISHKNLTLGLILILIGMLKKIILADNLAILVNVGFENYQNLEFFGSWLTSLCFTFQIYFDFSGYIDMATGIALLFNIRLPQNFESPYKATSIINFWQRWHITLSNFLMNCIYFPWIKSLKKINFLKAMLITFFVFIIAGIWHGPSWLFVIFGCLHGLGLIINHSFRKLFKFKINKYIGCFLTFNYVNLTFIFFKSETLAHSTSIIKGMLGLNGFIFPDFYENKIYIILILLISILITFIFKNTNYLLENLKIENK
jgi:D-alanyl-lipoteichoic acid acyltransferase DltB (MBOAT superfamily)